MASIQSESMELGVTEMLPIMAVLRSKVNVLVNSPSELFFISHLILLSSTSAFRAFMVLVPSSEKSALICERTAVPVRTSVLHARAR